MDSEENVWLDLRERPFCTLSQDITIINVINVIKEGANSGTDIMSGIK
jgi:hypothetical protein